MPRHRSLLSILGTAVLAQAACGAALPEFPPSNASCRIPAQEWSLKPGPRDVQVYVHYPGGALDRVNEGTGLMLSLHNWGGRHWQGTANPDVLADRYNVVAICVDYLQSGKWKTGGEPYDFGVLQAADSLRALAFVFTSLKEKNIDFDPGRLYACGGSGGGNVALMAAKLAPRTFACVVDMSGMARLSDNIAYGEDGGSTLDAGYRRDPSHPFYLSPADQELRFIGNPAHLRRMRELGCQTHFIVSHGATDSVCPVADAKEMVANMRAEGLSVEGHFIGEEDVDGETFFDTGHSVGDRTRILQHFADPYLMPGSERLLIREGPADFERRDTKVRYPVSGGCFVVDYTAGFPVLRFEKQTP